MSTVTQIQGTKTEMLCILINNLKIYPIWRMCLFSGLLFVGSFAFGFWWEGVLNFLYWARRQEILRHWDLREKMGEKTDLREKD